VKSKYPVDSVKRLFISSAPARRDTKLAIMQFFPNSQLFEMYGSTEAGWVTILRPDEQLTKLGSIGREWTGCGSIRLLDEAGNDVPDGEVGELFSRTPFTFREYWNNPGKTTEAFRGKYCSVGDMAYRDTDGFYYLVDRKSNMIISGGENVYPTEIETLLAAHPLIHESAVIGVPHDKWGEAVHAVIVLKPGASITGDEILAGARSASPGTSARARCRSSAMTKCRGQRPASSSTRSCATGSVAPVVDISGALRALSHRAYAAASSSSDSLSSWRGRPRALRVALIEAMVGKLLLQAPMRASMLSMRAGSSPSSCRSRNESFAGGSPCRDRRISGCRRGGAPAGAVRDAVAPRVRESACPFASSRSARRSRASVPAHFPSRCSRPDIRATARRLQRR
jgi:hypothetical protein